MAIDFSKEYRIGFASCNWNKYDDGNGGKFSCRERKRLVQVTDYL